MHADPARSRPTVRSLLFTAAIAVMGTLLFTVPGNARATDSDCTAVETAVDLQSKTPFHATVTMTATQAGAFPTSKQESVWIGNKMYLSMHGRWVGKPMSPDHALTGVTGGTIPFDNCKRLPDASTGGQATSVYAAKMQSGEPVQLFVSTKSGLILRALVDEDFMKITADFDYANVHAPALGK